MTLTLLMLLQVALCDGRATSKTKPFPMKPYVLDAETFQQYPVSAGRPPQGRWLIDPTFGTFFMRVSNSDPAARDGDGLRRGFTTTLYSSMPDWSNDERFQIFYTGTEGHVLHNGQPPFERIARLPIAPTDIEHVYWSWRPEKANVFYYPSSFAGERRLYKATVSPSGTIEKVALHDFKAGPTACTSTDARGLRLSTMGMSRDARELVGMSCGNVCWIYSIAEDKVLGSPNRDCETGLPSRNAPFMTPSGTRAYAATGQYKGLSFNVSDTLPLANVDYGVKEEHRSIGKSKGGADIYTSVLFEAQKSGAAIRPSATLMAVDMLTGAWKVLIGQTTGWPGPFTTVHTSMVSANNPGWIYASQVGAPDIGNPNPQGHNVLYAANYDTGQVCQLTHVRTWAGVRQGNKFGYWGEPHPNGSSSGRFVAWNSDWHNSDTVDVYILDNTRHLTAAQAAKVAGK